MFAVFAEGKVQPSPNPLAGSKWAARRGGEGNVERRGGKTKERMRKRGVRKGGVALAPRKKFLRHIISRPTLQFITKIQMESF